MLFSAAGRRSLLVSSSSSRWLQAAPATAARQHAAGGAGSSSGSSRRALSAATVASSHQSAARRTALVAAMGVAAATVDWNNRTNAGVLSVGALSCEKAARAPTAAAKKEPATGISFPAVLGNGTSLAGVGVRIKYVFVKVYAAGAYFDPIALMAVKSGSQADLERALLDPVYPRTIRIVMNRGLAVSKFVEAIVEAVEPRLKGKNLDPLDEFKEMFPKVDLQEGDEIELEIKGDFLCLKTARGGGKIRSRHFTVAMCNVFFGEDPVSPTLKADVLGGIPGL